MMNQKGRRSTEPSRKERRLKHSPQTKPDISSTRKTRQAGKREPAELKIKNGCLPSG
jgi:hypothetical protein